MSAFDLDKVKRISPGWWGAVAGAAAAGAALVPSSRLLAGALAAGAVFALALRNTPCCEGCAAGAGCAPTDTTSPPRATPTDVVVADASGGNAPPPFDPATLFARGRCFDAGCN
jgi:hypothetical protein